MLTEDDYRGILRAIAMVHAETDVARLPYAMMSAVEMLVPCIHIAYNELNPAEQKAVSFFNTLQPDGIVHRYLPVFERHMVDHPVLAYYMSERNKVSPPVRKIGDFLTQSTYRETPLYRECYRHLDTEHQIILPLSIEGITIGIAINRDRHEFSERDRATLELLRPHFVLAWQRNNARKRMAALFDVEQEDFACESLRRLGMTPQQARVLFWTIQGKTSPEIAMLLASKPRTIHKHVEHIFRKLGVNNRAAAISITIELLNQIEG